MAEFCEDLSILSECCLLAVLGRRQGSVAVQVRSWKLRGYLGAGRVVLQHEQMAYVRPKKSGQMQAK